MINREPARVAGFFMAGSAQMTQYDEGRRDAEIEELKRQVRGLFNRVDDMKGWQNRAIGYVTAAGTLASIIVQMLMKKVGA